MTYQQEAIRRGGATPEAAACRRPLKSRSDFVDWTPDMRRMSLGNPGVCLKGRADPHRRPALLVARVLVCEYATLLAPWPPRSSARRGRGVLC